MNVMRSMRLGLLLATAIALFVCSGRAHAASDDFTGSNGTALATHNSNWLAGPDDGVSPFTLDGSGNAHNVNAGNLWARAYYSGSQQDVSCITIPAGSAVYNQGGAASFQAPAIKMTSSQGGYWVYLRSSTNVNTNVDQYTVQRNGSYLNGGDLNAVHNLNTTPQTVCISFIVGSGTVRFTVGADAAIDFVDSSPLTGGYDGISSTRNEHAISLPISDWNNGVTGTTLAPSAASLAFTGATAGIVRGTNLAPSSVAMAFTGATPGVVRGTNLVPSSVAMAFTGATPTVISTSGNTLSPGAATLSLSGSTSTIVKTTYTWYVLPAPGNYDSNSILAGQTYPSGSWLRVVTDWAHITADYATGPLDGDINDYATAETGYTGTDTATYEIKTNAGSSSQYTITANINDSISLGPTAASLSFTGQTPTVAVTNNKTAAPTVASLALTGATPTVISGNNKVVAPAAASLSLAGAALTVLVSNNISLSPQAASLTFTGYPPRVNGTSNNRRRSMHFGNTLGF